jgi:hypothetical protein
MRRQRHSLCRASLATHSAGLRWPLTLPGFAGHSLCRASLPTHSAGLRCPSARTSCPGWVLSQCQVRSEAYASTRAQCTPFVEAEQRRPRPAVPPHRAAPAGTNARKPQRGWFRQVRFYTEADAAKQLRVMQASGKYGKVADARADLVPLAQVRARHSHQNRPVTAGVCLSAHGRARKAVSHLDTGRRSHVRIAHY